METWLEASGPLLGFVDLMHKQPMENLQLHGPISPCQCWIKFKLQTNQVGLFAWSKDDVNKTHLILYKIWQLTSWQLFGLLTFPKTWGYMPSCQLIYLNHPIYNKLQLSRITLVRLGLLRQSVIIDPSTPALGKHHYFVLTSKTSLYENEFQFQGKGTHSWWSPVHYLFLLILMFTNFNFFGLSYH